MKHIHEILFNSEFYLFQLQKNLVRISDRYGVIAEYNFDNHNQALREYLNLIEESDGKNFSML